jgi:hypothetical protein
MPGFIIFCSPSIGTLPMRRAARAARGAAACCIPPPIGAKPRGRACHVGPAHDRRFSFCCAVDGCRRRATPPSLRFLGRKVYLAAVVVLVSMMRHGATEPRLRQLTAAASTAGRWRAGRPGGARSSRRAVLAGRPRQVHAAGRPRRSAGHADGAFQRRGRRPIDGVAEVHRPRHGRHGAGSIAVANRPHRMLVAAASGFDLGSALSDLQESRHDAQPRSASP